jgi:3-oxoacyl-[acyl-carrier-protein] synthase-3
MPKAKITALGTYVPPRVLTNHDLEKMVETNDQWIVERTGIRERHIADENIATSDMAIAAARCALAQRGIDGSAVDAIIVCTVTPDMFFPSTACLVQDALSARGAISSPPARASSTEPRWARTSWLRERIAKSW